VNIPNSLENIKVIDPKIGRKIFIFWDLPEEVNFDQILVYRSEVEDRDQRGELVAQLANSNLFYEDNGVEDGKSYYYLVLTAKSATTAGTESDRENQLIITIKTGNGEEKKLITSENIQKVVGTSTDSFPPAPPKNLEIINIGDGKSINIFWENPDDDDFDHINIYQSTKKGELGRVLEIDNTKIQKQEGDGKSNTRYSYTVTSVISNITYYYTLTSVDLSGNESAKKVIDAQGRNNPFEPFITL
jgi:fibronectin type 3 domain-containing protein